MSADDHIAVDAGPAVTHPRASVDAHRETLDSAAPPRVAPAAADELPDRIGRLVVLDALGEGAMGRVMSAYDPGLDRRVAVKLLHGRTEELEQTLRVRREAAAMARLSHPNVVQVYEVGQFGQQTYICMEYVEGRTLDAWQIAEGPTWREVVAMYVRVGAGLTAAHDAGLIHRDFKPQNVLVGRSGRPRIIDFGLARADGAVVPAEDEDDVELPDHDDVLRRTLTRDGSFVGTPAYMPPEQMKGRGVSAAADQFAFCVALYEALYGQAPFDGSTLVFRLLAMERGAVAPPPADSPVSASVHQAIMRGLSADPADRWPSMEALCEALIDDPESDRGAAWRERVALFAGMLSLSLVLPVVGWLIGGEALGSWTGTFISHGIALAGVGVVALRYRRAILASAHNRRVATVLAAVLLCSVVPRLFGLVAGGDAYVSAVYVLSADALICAIGGALVARWFWATSAVFLLGAALAALLLDHMVVIYVGTMTVALCTALLGTIGDARASASAPELSALGARLDSIGRSADRLLSRRSKGEQ